MVFHVTNFMKETNVWMIRKMRWILWSCVFSVPLFRATYWSYHGRRVAWYEKFDRRSEEEKIEDAKKDKANWGYHPRYEPTYEHSMKHQKYALQSREETVHDTPRLRTNAHRDKKKGLTPPKDVRTLSLIAREHNRIPGVFDYDFPQDFYSTHMNIDVDAYVTLGSDKSRKLWGDWDVSR